MAALVNRLSPPPLQSNGVQRLLSTWKTPADSARSTTWLEKFSEGIEPVACHSHNDYWRSVPLFTAVSAGCIGVEADIWPSGDANGSLLVGHDRSSLAPDRTLESLYISPLRAILDYQNPAVGGNATTRGLFESSPQTTLVLLLDFKVDGQAVWTAVQRELQPLREAGWLTRWDVDASRRITGPITIVVTGAASLDMVEIQTSHDVFYDAPLGDLDGGEYTIRNSYYASASMADAVGSIRWRLRDGQFATLQENVREAEQRGLVSRYWGAPTWPVAVRNGVWEDLVSMGIGILNVDELSTAARWDWRFCIILGLTICK